MKRTSLLVCCLSVLMTISLVETFWYCCLRSPRVGELSDHRGVHAAPSESFQCAHWSILRSCELMGIPVSRRYLLQALLPCARGHSLQQMSNCLKSLGLLPEGCRDSWDTLMKSSFPCIVHLEEPDHFVVICGVDPKEGYVHVFDAAGRRTRRSRATFEERWNGITLHLKRNERSTPVQPIGFDYLILDKGDIPAVAKPVEFAFPIYNNSESDLVIRDVRVSCSCLKTEIPTKAIAPGDTGIIRVFYHVEPQEGAFSQSALVLTNQQELDSVILTACGYAGVEVRLSPTRLTLDRLFTGRDCVATVYLRYTGEWDDLEVDASLCQTTNIELVGVQCWTTAKSTDRGDRSKGPHRLLLTFRPTGGLGDEVEGAVLVKTNISGYEELRIPVSGEIESPVEAYPRVLAFGDVASTEFAQHEVMLVSRCGEPFRVRDVRLGRDVLEDEQAHYDRSLIGREIPLTLTCRGKMRRAWAGRELLVSLELQSSGQRILLPLKVAAGRTHAVVGK